MGEFSSSEDELENVDNRPAAADPLRLDFINLYRLGLCDCLALSSLPGCRFRDVQRSLREDVRTIVERGITDVLVLMQHSEFRKYRVPNLLEGGRSFFITFDNIQMKDGPMRSYRYFGVFIDDFLRQYNLIRKCDLSGVRRARPDRPPPHPGGRQRALATPALPLDRKSCLDQAAVTEARRLGPITVTLQG